MVVVLEDCHDRAFHVLLLGSAPSISGKDTAMWAMWARVVLSLSVVLGFHVFSANFHPDENYYRCHGCSFNFFELIKSSFIFFTEMVLAFMKTRHGDKSPAL